MGRIHDANGDWHIPLLAVALISLVMAVCGALAGRDRKLTPMTAAGGIIVPRRGETPAPAARDARPARDAHAGTRWRQKRVRHQLDGADLTLFIPAGDAQIALLQLRRKRAAHAVPAVVALFNALPAIGAGNQRIRPQLDDGRGLHQRAAEGAITIRPSLSVSACPASCQPSTLRAYSITAC